MVITKFLSLLMFTFANISAISVYMVLTKKFLDFIKIYNIYSYIYIYTNASIYMFKKRRIPKGNKLKACKVSFGRPQLVRSNPREMLPLWMLRQDWVVQLRVRPYIDLEKIQKNFKKLNFNFLKKFILTFQMEQNLNFL